MSFLDESFWHYLTTGYCDFMYYVTLNTVQEISQITFFETGKEAVEATLKLVL